MSEFGGIRRHIGALPFELVMAAGVGGHDSSAGLVSCWHGDVHDGG